MKDTFGSKVVAIAQERHSANEFKENQVISDLEKEIYSPEELDLSAIRLSLIGFQNK